MQKEGLSQQNLVETYIACIHSPYKSFFVQELEKLQVIGNSKHKTTVYGL